MACNCRKQQTKQASPLSRVFMANLVPGCTEVPYNCKTGPIPSLILNLEPRSNWLTEQLNWMGLNLKSNWTPTPCVYPFLYTFCPDITHIIDTSSHDVTMTSCRTTYVTMQCSDDVMLFLVETHVHASLHKSGSSSLRACPLVCPRSPCSHGD